MFTAEEDKPERARTSRSSARRCGRSASAAIANVLGRTLKLSGRAVHDHRRAAARSRGLPGQHAAVGPAPRRSRIRRGRATDPNGVGRLKRRRDGRAGRTGSPARASADLGQARSRTKSSRRSCRPLHEMTVRDFRTAASTLTRRGRTAPGRCLRQRRGGDAGARARAPARDGHSRRAWAPAAGGCCGSCSSRTCCSPRSAASVGLLLGQWAIRTLIAQLPDQAPPLGQLRRRRARDGVCRAGARSSRCCCLAGRRRCTRSAATSGRRCTTSPTRRSPRRADGGRCGCLIGGGVRARHALARLRRAALPRLRSRAARRSRLQSGGRPDLHDRAARRPPIRMPPTRLAFWDRVEERMAAMPGVRSRRDWSPVRRSVAIGERSIDREGQPPRRPERGESRRALSLRHAALLSDAWACG